MNTLVRLLIVSFVLVFLSACMTAPKDDENDVSVDYILLKIEADKAYKDKDYKAAEEKYIKITKGVPRDPDAWFKLGNIFARTQRPNYAVRAYKEAVLRDSKLTKAWNNLAVVYLRQSLNAYTSLVNHAGSNDRLIEEAKTRLDKIYDIVGEEVVAKPPKNSKTVDDPTKPIFE